MYTTIININIGHMVHKHWSHGSLAYSMYATVSKTMSCIYYSNAFTAVINLYSMMNVSDKKSFTYHSTLND